MTGGGTNRVSDEQCERGKDVRERDKKREQKRMKGSEIDIDWRKVGLAVSQQPAIADSYVYLYSPLCM